MSHNNTFATLLQKTCSKKYLFTHQLFLYKIPKCFRFRVPRVPYHLILFESVPIRLDLSLPIDKPEKLCVKYHDKVPIKSSRSRFRGIVEVGFLEIKSIDFSLWLIKEWHLFLAYFELDIRICYVFVLFF